MGVSCSTNGENRKACEILVLKPESNSPFWKTNGILEDNIKTNV